MYARRPLRSLAFALVCASTVAACDPRTGTGSAPGRGSAPWSHSYTLAADGELQVVGASGSIDIVGIDGDTVEVTATRTVRASSDAQATELAGMVRIAEDVTPDRVVLRSEGLGAMGLGRQVTVDFHLRVPRATRVRVHAANGNIKASNLAGNVVLATTNGIVMARAMSGAVDAETTNGTVTLELAAVGAGAVGARATNGSLSVTLPQDARVTVDAGATSGTLDVASLGLAPDGAQSDRHVRGTMNGGGIPITLATTNGDVQVRTAAGAHP